MSTPNEYTLVEKPILDTLAGQYGYRYIRPDEHEDLRTRENEVLSRPLPTDPPVRSNRTPRPTAQPRVNHLS
ncbi:MAG: hypothetical protein GY719_08730, partial [bacterium]|nr:hypothetical protein [bacterium]